MRWLPVLVFLFIASPAWSQTSPPPIVGNSAGFIVNPGTPDKGKWIVENGARITSMSQTPVYHGGGYYPLQTISELTFVIRYGLFNWLELNSEVAAGIKITNGITNDHFAPILMGAKASLINDSIIGQLSLSGEIAYRALTGSRKGSLLPQVDLRFCYATPFGSKLPLEVNGGILHSIGLKETTLLQVGLRTGLSTPAEGWSFWVAYFGYADFKRASHWADFTIIKQVDDQLQLHVNMALELHPGLYFQRQYRIKRYGQGSFGATYSFQ